MTKDEIPLFPVAHITVGPVPSLGFVIIRPDFLTNLSQTPEQSQPGRSYALTINQANYLIQKIQQALDLLENASSQNDTDLH